MEASLVAPKRLEVARSLEARSLLNLTILMIIECFIGDMNFHRGQARDGEAGRD